jgi:hypothetical protein
VTAPNAPDFLAGSVDQCAECDERHATSEDFTYRGLHFCINCMSELISWFLDGGCMEEPDRYDWTGIDLIDKAKNSPSRE